MKLLGYTINNFTCPVMKQTYIPSNMREAIEQWLKNNPTYDLHDCSNDRDTRYILEMFQSIKERTGATTIQMIEYFYSLEKQIEDLELTLEDFINNSD